MTIKKEKAVRLTIYLIVSFENNILDTEEEKNEEQETQNIFQSNTNFRINKKEVAPKQVVQSSNSVFGSNNLSNIIPSKTPNLKNTPNTNNSNFNSIFETENEDNTSNTFSVAKNTNLNKPPLKVASGIKMGNLNSTVNKKVINNFYYF